LLQQDSLLPWTVILEVVYITYRERGEAEADYRYALLKQLPATILWEIDEPVLLTAAQIKAGFRVSLADAIIAAYTHQHKATLIHKDPEFESLAAIIHLEALPYK
jgi:predicted nucleic acid-binding protein